MGTHATLYLAGKYNELFPVGIYTQYDGGPENYGEAIKNFVEGAELGNGITGDKNPKKFFNGMADLSIRLATLLKGDPDDVGGVYLAEHGLENILDIWSEHKMDDYSYLLKWDGKKFVLMYWRFDSFQGYLLGEPSKNLILADDDLKPLIQHTIASKNPIKINIDFAERTHFIVNTGNYDTTRLLARKLIELDDKIIGAKTALLHPSQRIDIEFFKGLCP